MDRYLFVALTIGVFFAGVTWLLHRYVKHQLVKYAPSFLAVLIAAYQIILARISTGGFEDLIRGILAVLLVYGAFFGIVTAVVLDIKAKKKE